METITEEMRNKVLNVIKPEAEKIGMGLTAPQISFMIQTNHKIVQQVLDEFVDEGKIYIRGRSAVGRKMYHRA